MNIQDCVMRMGCAVGIVMRDDVMRVSGRCRIDKAGLDGYKGTCRVGGKSQRDRKN